VGIAQVAHAAGESIVCREGWRCSSSQITLGGLALVKQWPNVPYSQHNLHARIRVYVYKCIIMRYSLYTSRIADWIPAFHLNVCSLEDNRDTQV